jgi:UDP-glucose 4-epimerase
VAPLDGARVLVTGASGFIGSHLVRRLTETGAEVHAMTSGVSLVYPSRLLDVRTQIHLHEANLVDPSAINALVRRVQPTHVFHLGAFTHVGKSWRRIDECAQTNVQGTLNLLLGLEPHGYQRLVFVGTSEIYGTVDVPFREDAKVQPVSPYAVSKYAAECYCRMFHVNYGWPIVMLRPFNAYGPAQSPDRIIPEVVVRALRGQQLLMTAGDQTREFNYVEDLVEGMVAAASVPGIEGELFNLGNGEELSIREVATTVLGLMGNPITPQFGALQSRPTEIKRMVSTSENARERLGWAPSVSLDDGLKRTIDWYTRQLERSPSPFEL